MKKDQSMAEIIAGSRSSFGKTYDPGLLGLRYSERCTLSHLSQHCWVLWSFTRSLTFEMQFCCLTFILSLQMMTWSYMNFWEREERKSSIMTEKWRDERGKEKLSFREKRREAGFKEKWYRKSKEKDLNSVLWCLSSSFFTKVCSSLSAHSPYKRLREGFVQ